MVSRRSIWLQKSPYSHSWTTRVEKYRPKSLEELISQEDIVSTRNCLDHSHAKPSKFYLKVLLKCSASWSKINCHTCSSMVSRGPHRIDRLLYIYTVGVLKDLRAQERRARYWRVRSRCINRPSSTPWYLSWTRQTTVASELCAIKFSALPALKLFSSQQDYLLCQ